jgi:hypothetical protein
MVLGDEQPPPHGVASTLFPFKAWIFHVKFPESTVHISTPNQYSNFPHRKSWKTKLAKNKQHHPSLGSLHWEVSSDSWLANKRARVRFLGAEDGWYLNGTMDQNGSSS